MADDAAVQAPVADTPPKKSNKEQMADLQGLGINAQTNFFLRQVCARLCSRRA